MIGYVTRLGTAAATHWCDGCETRIEPGTWFLEHENTDPGLMPWDLIFLAECLACAARNGRPGFAEPDVAEQPLDLEGIA
jgi:hypothetical protein